MSVSITPLMDGPDFIGSSTINIYGLDLDGFNSLWYDGTNKNLVIGFTVNLNRLRDIFGKVGEAIKLIEVNADSS